MKNIWFNKNNNKKLQEENNNNNSSVNCKPRLGSIQNKTKTTKREKFATKKEHNFCFAESRQLKRERMKQNETITSKWGDLSNSILCFDKKMDCNNRKLILIHKKNNVKVNHKNNKW